MSSPHPDLADRVGRRHPAVIEGRARERALLLLTMLVPLVLALAVSVEMPDPTVKSVIEVFGILLGAVGVVALVRSTRYAVTLTVLAFYLGVLDGPIKLEAASKVASGFRDVLIVAIGLGMLMRATGKRERLALPPLSGWVLGFVIVTIVEALNPDTKGILKVIGGYRQQLEFVPLFFFGYAIMRSKQRFRQLFLIFGVIALANGVVGAYQSRLSPGDLAGWGPGYGSDVKGKSETANGLGRTYAVEGVTHPRPPALGSDSGFGGGIGVLALPGLLAMLTVPRLRRRWAVLVCAMGAIAGIATSASRTEIVVGVVVVITFAALSLLARLRVGRPLAGLMILAVLTGGVGWALVAADGSEIFHRQLSVVKLVSGEETEGGGHESGDDGKEKHLNEIPRDLVDAPFGLGLGVSGSAGGFGGHEKVTIESEKVSGGSAYNLLAVELGAPGLLLWVGLTLMTIGVGVSRLRRIVDPELRVYMVALLTVFIGFTIQGLAGTTIAVTPAGAYVWFAPGVVAYWFLGPGRTAMRSRRSTPIPAVSVASA
jgi:hypothetical protein